MADFTKFTSPPITSFSYDVAVEGADEAAKAQAVAAFGNSDYQVGGASELKVKFNDDGTYTATSILYAAPTDSPAPEVSPAEDEELPQPVDPTTLEGFGIQASVDPTTLEGFGIQASVDPTTLEGFGIQASVDPTTLEGFGLENIPSPGPLFTGNPQAEAAAAQAATLQQARDQQTLGARLKNPSNGDWRVKISLAQNSDYLYNDVSAAGGVNSILAPLKATGGVIFPYTPTIETNYKANYDVADLTHSNYRGYFYKNSYVDAVQIRGMFTAQDTREASYLLAVIHFFRSVTKMFYGQDPAYRGSPPPLVYLTGMGQYQFNNHASVVSNFAYSLPNDVDYVRVDPNNYGLNMLAQKTPAFTGAGDLLSAIKARLTSAGGLPLGGIFQPPIKNTVNQTVNTTGNATYVPTKMEISLTLLPVQSRRQVSQQFSLKDFANGNQLRGGFW
jgi:hypothetical protein